MRKITLVLFLVALLFLVGFLLIPNFKGKGDISPTTRILHEIAEDHLKKEYSKNFPEAEQYLIANGKIGGETQFSSIKEFENGDTIGIGLEYYPDRTYTNIIITINLDNLEFYNLDLPEKINPDFSKEISEVFLNKNIVENWECQYERGLDLCIVPQEDILVGLDGNKIEIILGV